jgi:D-alanyl-D-alanine endopeptidase (penicillin-binding protein 7)
MPFFQTSFALLSRCFGVCCLGLVLSLPAYSAASDQTNDKQSKNRVTKAVKHAAPSQKVAKTKARKLKQASARKAIPEKLSFGHIAGLQGAFDPLSLKSSVALVIDQDTREVLLSKNENAVLPIASITKLMTGVIISAAKLSMDEVITVTQDDVDTEKGSSSRLRVGTMLTRGELLHLALMASENRAAHALGRTYPGGMDVFVGQMNSMARLLGMNDTRYVEPTGLSRPGNSGDRGAR